VDNPTLEKLKELAACGRHSMYGFDSECSRCSDRLAVMTPAYTLGLSQGRWIPVEDGLPEPLLSEFEGQFSDTVEMYDRFNNHWLGFYDFGAKQWWMHQGQEDDSPMPELYTITHWRELLNPKAVKNDD
jgi:hypothetical protein